MREGSYKPKRRRPCKICGADLNMWGPERKGICPDCAKARRETMLVCAGRCRRRYPLGYLEPLTVYFSPGHKGGKKITLYYCTACLVSARSRTEGHAEEQQAAIQRTEERMSRKAQL